MRVIVTGSRDYAERYNNLIKNDKQPTAAEANKAKDLDLIDLRKAWKYFHQTVKFADTAGHKSIKFVHGDCPRGFDKICSEWIANMKQIPDLNIEILEEKHPADWVTHGPSAGPIRNTEMVELGASFGIAGWYGDRDKGGTLDCMSKMAMASIDIKICTPAKE